MIKSGDLPSLPEGSRNLQRCCFNLFTEFLHTGSSELHSSTPLPRPKLGTRSWGVRLGQNGLLDVAEKPPVQQRTLEILSRVLDSGHELSEDEMVELFEARGADFDAVCSAAGEIQTHSMKICSS